MRKITLEEAADYALKSAKTHAGFDYFRKYAEKKKIITTYLKIIKQIKNAFFDIEGALKIALNKLEN